MNFKSFVCDGSPVVAYSNGVYEHARPDCRVVWLYTDSRDIDVMALYRRIHHFHGAAMLISSDTFYHNDGMRTALRRFDRHPLNHYLNRTP